MKALTSKRCGRSPEIGFSDLPRPTLKADVVNLGTGSSAGFAVVPEAAAALKPAHLDFVQMR
ncbi:MAG: hypothetical protein IV093_11485 [Rubrivivax sp.]|nr:hypothetical protein [Rubrivivax sp.]